MDDRIYDLVAKELAGESTEADSKELQEWLELDEENKSIFGTISQYWVKGNEITDESKKQVFKRIKKRINTDVSNVNNDKLNKHKSQKIMPEWLKIAAIVICTIGVSWLVYNNQSSHQEPVQLVEKSNPMGQKSMLFLSDGSKVILNAGSRISYSKRFDQNERRVVLDGEAFFEVVKDASRPFRVVSHGIITTALGTSFNIEARSDQNIKVALVTGKVNVSLQNNTDENKSVVLTPQELATYSGESKELKKTHFDLDELLGWKDGIIYFKDADQEVIIEKLERWYGVKIQTINQSNEKVEITTSFKNESLENVLKSLSYTLAFEFTISDKEISIKYLN